ncbi:DUF3558 family protein [Gordonia sp. DT101]|uniref:DUF3558 family protein n=1 Tax=Gordonia sp. DT101 TaxID=3416545 RepID=UPI003CEF1470
MKLVRRLSWTIATTALVAMGAVACGDDPATDNTASSSNQIPTGVAAQSASVENPTQLSGADICAVLSPEDVAPLTNGKVTDSPKPTDTQGLPGCKWAVQDGWGWLEIGVSKPTNESALISASKSNYQVGGGTAYEQFDEGLATCQAYVQVPGAPKGYGLRISLDAPMGQLDKTNLCESAIPQTEKVLKALGW